MPQHEVSRIAAITAAATLLLSACGRHAAPTQASTAPPIAPAHGRFVSHRYAIAIDFPSTVAAVRGAVRGHLDAGRWKLLAGRHSRGTPLLALTLPHSNRIASATLRIGASRDTAAVKRCLQAPPGATDDHQGVQLGGIDFATFQFTDGGMSHFLVAHAYRAVHAGICYAIDLRVSGTDPGVYDPPAHAPFSRDDAMQRLRQLLGGIHFLH